MNKMKRAYSLDAFRGYAILTMRHYKIFCVNGKYGIQV